MVKKVLLVPQSIQRHGKINLVYLSMSIKTRSRSVFLKTTQYSKSIEMMKRREKDMCHTKETPPALAVDLKKQRIRIHKQTLYLLNNPRYIQLLVNPEKKAIIIKTCNKNDYQAHRINYGYSKDCEFYSKELVKQLSIVSSNLTEGHTYRILGILHSDAGFALFQMDTLFTEQ